MKIKIQKRLIIWGIAILIFFGILEGILRISGIKTGDEMLKQFFTYEPLLGWKLIPNKKGRFKTKEFDIEVKINSDGFRDYEYSIVKKRKSRIIMLGDSYLWGWGVELEETFSKYIEKALKCEVINMGVPAYGTDQEYLFFMRKGLKYSPDIVILCFYTNDLWDNLRTEQPGGYGKPKFVNKNGKLYLTNVPVPPPSFYQNKNFITRTKIFLRNHFATYIFLRNLLKKNRIIVHILQKTKIMKKWGEYSNIYRTHLSKEIKNGWEITEMLITQLNNFLTAKGIIFMVVYLPSREQINSFNAKNTQIDLHMPNKILKKICRKNNILFLDTTPFLCKYSPNKIYFKTDNHFNSFGHLIVGKILSKFIKIKLKDHYHFSKTHISANQVYSFLPFNLLKSFSLYKYFSLQTFL